MPINAYTGLMGSGKSFECVVSVILPAICVGRRVVTNVDGIDNESCRAYCHEKYDIPLANLGHIIHCTNDDVKRVDFLPHGIDVDTFCKAGDMVCIDEAWRFWGTDCKILKEHAIFFREHRHYVDDTTKVSCDLVLMVQDITDLHRTLKVVVEISFRTTKIKSLGLSKVYRVEMWEGYKQTARARVSVENKTYDKEIFPLYSSYVGGNGKELQVDKRQNILNSKKLWMMAAGILVLGSVGLYGVIHFFDASRYDKKTAKNSPIGSQGDSGLNLVPGTASPKRTASTDVSEAWRISGTIQSDGISYVVLSSVNGRVRLEHPSNFQNSGSSIVGIVDGERITIWSGALVSSSMLPEVKK
ncbi:zonular occludens toxin domain-containing protein [Undibacterium sp. Ji67W]|uniref:zonular occludens toxin domain-containing protein n=1 Tax=Undibacterium sp. Ji67W TaxID=3413042 RepID=UPI003BF32997